ncbi:MAG: ABC transporter substrate-binding protein [Methanotrichaceae archaeon]|nr:ABC transporter substrate-binding protein [Methanotrichaceae archaeon]
MKITKVVMLVICVLSLALGLSFSGAWGLERVLYYAAGSTAHPDPHMGTGYVDTTVYINSYDSLVRPGKDYKVGPHIATDWTVSDDRLTFTFNLRKGVLFHDSSELTAEDVAFSMTRLIKLGRGFSFLFRDIVESVEAADKYTVKFKLRKQFGPFVSTLVRFFIVNKKCILANKKPGDFGEFGDYGVGYLTNGGDCGSGPYKITGFVAQSHVHAEKFPKYWQGFAPNAPDRIEQTLLIDPTALKTKMKVRELDISSMWMPPEWYADVDKIEGIDISYTPTLSQCYLQMNNQKPPLDDIHFRKALSWAFDYKSVVEHILPASKQAVGSVPGRIVGHNPNVYQYRQDLKKAEEELKKSKYYKELKKYMPIELAWLNTVPSEEKIGLLMKRDAAKIGIDVELIKEPWVRIIEEVSNVNTTRHIYAIFVSADYPEAISLLFTKWHSKGTGKWSQSEWLQNPEVDKMIDDTLSTFDTEERINKSKKLQEKIVDLAPSIFLVDNVEMHAYQSGYIDWPKEVRENPIMGYAYEARLISVYPEKREELRKK